jgi:hypothetical protein
MVCCVLRFMCGVLGDMGCDAFCVACVVTLCDVCCGWCSVCGALDVVWGLV